MNIIIFWLCFFCFFYSDDKFDILVDRVCEKLIYKNVSVKEFELRAENNEAFYFRFDVKENEDSFVDDWPIGMPALPWGGFDTSFGLLNHRDGKSQPRTFYYDGHSVIADLKTLDDMVDINCADTVLCYQKFEVIGIVVFNIRNAEQNKKIVLFKILEIY